MGEGSPRPRLEPTRRAVELLGDPHRAAPVIHITGTNGKTSTSRMIESLLRASGLRTGLLTSPHLERFTERIRIDGEPIDDEAVARNWDEILPFIVIVDVELEQAGEAPLTFFEVLTVLAFACFADAPVDVVVLEVGMGGEWDSTNVADGQVAVFTPIALDHESRLGSTIEAIARTKSGIIKPAAAVVTAIQTRRGTGGPRACGRPHRVDARRRGRRVRRQSSRRSPWAASSSRSAVWRGVRRCAVCRSSAGTRRENAAVAVAAVEAFIGGGSVRLADSVVQLGLGAATSPGRLQVVGAEPTIVVDAAHNPHGAAALVAGLDEYFDFDEVAFVFGVLADKDVAGIVDTLARRSGPFVVTAPESDRAVPAEQLGTFVADRIGADRVSVAPRLDDALDEARAWAAEAPQRAVVVAGSIALVGEAMIIAADREWGALMADPVQPDPTPDTPDDATRPTVACGAPARSLRQEPRRGHPRLRGAHRVPRRTSSSGSGSGRAGRALPSWVALAAGGVIIVALIATIGLLRHSWAYVLGWVLQLLILASGFLNPAMFVVGVIFGGMWWYAMVVGARIDRQHAAAAAAGKEQQ